MNPTSTKNFNRYKYHNHSIDVHRQTKFNPLQDFNMDYAKTVSNHKPIVVDPFPVQNAQTFAPSKPKPTLTNTLNKEIFHTLKNKEKEFVQDMNYYQSLNRYGLPEVANNTLNQSLGRTKNRFVRGESYAKENGMVDTIQPLKNSTMCTNSLAFNKKDDFLDRFIKRQNNWQGYYKNNEKLESLNCEKHPGFIKNSEFLPSTKENDAYQSEGYVYMKKSKLLPNSVIVDRNYKEIEIDKQWAKNYSGVLNNQKVFKDVNNMNLTSYNRMTRNLNKPYVELNESKPIIDPVLKKTILDVYKH